MREEYEISRDIGTVHRMLQEQFESFLKTSLGLNEGLVEDIVSRGWGSAGVRKGNTIIATKIPKSTYLVDYLKECDPEKRRQYYCHCPRIRDSVKASIAISPVYCYCGAGFYSGIWKEITQKPVKVELLKSVLKGDDVCTFSVTLLSK
jgi:hypothetical protein